MTHNIAAFEIPVFDEGAKTGDYHVVNYILWKDQKQIYEKSKDFRGLQT